MFVDAVRLRGMGREASLMALDSTGTGKMVGTLVYMPRLLGI
jgi:hypothetical protein